MCDIHLLFVFHIHSSFHKWNPRFVLSGIVMERSSTPKLFRRVLSLILWKMQNREAERLNCSTNQSSIKCSKYHSSIIGLPTELWVKRMMEVAGLEGLIDPEDFVFYLVFFSSRQINM